MALDVVSTCTVADKGVLGVPGLAILLSCIFLTYILIDSLLAASIITRKAAEAENAVRAS